MTDTAPCTKCGSEISTEVERCKECGYEPSTSTLGTLFFWLIALPWSVIFGLFIFAGLIGALLGEITVTEFIGGLFASAILGSIPFWYTHRYLKIRKKKPTEN
jgi:hypothetical protein